MAQRRRSDVGDRESAPENSEESAAQAPPAPARDITSDEIAIRAYELYEQRGGEHGRDWDDWLEAERELQRQRRSPGPTPS